MHYHKKTRTRTEGIIARVSREFPSYFSLLPKKKKKKKKEKKNGGHRSKRYCRLYKAFDEDRREER